MAEDSDRPVVFIIHGAWHRPLHMQPLISKLNEKGYEAVCHQNPTGDNPPTVETTPDSPQTQYGLAEDAAFASSNLVELIERQKRLVFVLCHSWGGMVCSEAVVKEFSAAERNGRGEQGGVVGLLYMCAYLIPACDKLVEWRSGGKAGPNWADYNVRLEPNLYSVLSLWCQQHRMARMTNRRR